MQYIFSSRNRQVLKTFALSNTLVAFDFDGTLAPIAQDRAGAGIRETTRNLLAKLTLLYPCAVISGRAQIDVRRRLRGTGISKVVGNHGIEPWNATPAMERSVRRWLPLLQDKLRQFRGVAIESKRFSVAVHYRQARRKAQARGAIAATIRSLGPVRVVGGKQVVNLIPAGAPHKGMAMERMLRELGCRRAIYFGDDDTDEDVFSLSDRGRLLGIRVGRNHTSLARYYTRSQREVDRAIQTLVELRSGVPGRRFLRRRRAFSLTKTGVNLYH